MTEQHIAISHYADPDREFERISDERDALAAALRLIAIGLDRVQAAGTADLLDWQDAARVAANKARAALAKLDTK